MDKILDCDTDLAAAEHEGLGDFCFGSRGRLLMRPVLLTTAMLVRHVELNQLMRTTAYAKQEH